MKHSQCQRGIRVMIQNVAKCWEGQIGYIQSWAHDSFYVIRVYNKDWSDHTDLLLNLDKNEFKFASDEMISRGECHF